jgi:hypothetical protein
VPSNSLQFIPSQSLSHPLLHQRSSRSKHFNFAVVDFHVAKIQDARTINNITVFLAVTVAVAIAGRGLRRVDELLAKQLPVESNLGCQASDLVAVLGVYVGQNSVCAL